MYCIQSSVHLVACKYIQSTIHSIDSCIHSSIYSIHSIIHAFSPLCIQLSINFSRPCKYIQSPISLEENWRLWQKLVLLDNKRFIVDYDTWGPPNHISAECQTGTLGRNFLRAWIQNGCHRVKENA